MEREPLVSIIVPVHNDEDTIKRCVNSLVKQTYSKLEIILVENNSSDKSSELCDSFKDSRINVIHSSEQGVSRARNTGLKIANGEFITFCDADDYYTVDHIKRNVKVALFKNVDIVISGYYFEKSNGQFEKIVLNDSKVLNSNEIINNIVTNNFIMGVCWNKLFRSSSLNNCSFPEDMSILEDTYFLLKVLQNTNKVYYLDKALYYYCNNKNSAVRNLKTLINEDESQVLYISAYDKILNNFNLSLKTQELIRARIFEFAVWARCLYINGKINSEKTIENINEHIKKNKKYFINCKYFTVKRKLKSIIMFYFPKFFTQIKKIKIILGE